MGHTEEKTAAMPGPLFRTYSEPSHEEQPLVEKDEISLENRIGSQWFNRIGIVAVLIGMAWFLKYAIDNQWIGPLGRILIGLVAGAGLIAWSEKFLTKGYTVFSYSLKAVGSGILYLSLWASFSVYHLLPAGVAFVAMVLVTAFNGFMAWRQDSELLALYAIAGGISTPVMLSTGENHELILFGYIMLLDLAVLALTILRPWSRLLFAAYVGTVIMVAGWWFTFYSRDQFALTLFFVTCFTVLFASAPRLVRVHDRSIEDAEPWDALVLAVQPVMNALLAFLAYLVLFDEFGMREAKPWIAVTFAAFYLLQLRLPARGVWKPASQLTASLHLATAVVFLTLAIPLKTHGRWLTMGWLAEGAALVWVARRVHMRLLAMLAGGCLLLGLAAIFAVNGAAGATPVLNARFATYCFAIAVFGFVAWLLAQPAEPLPDMQVFSSICLVLMNLLIFIAVTTEIHAYWSKWSTGGTLGNYNASLYEWCCHASFLMIFGAALLAAAVAQRSVLLRWLAVIVLAMGVLSVVSTSANGVLTPVFNPRFATYCLAIALVGWSARQLARPLGDENSAWRVLPIIGGLLVNLLILIAVATEIHSYWSALVYEGTSVNINSIYEQFSYSAFFMLYGALLLVLGFWRRSSFLRWQALVLLALSIGKVFLVDMSALSQGFRILSFLGLGVLLLAVSFVYQRDWLNLRGAGKS